MDINNQFYTEILDILQKSNVKYILIGGLAVAYYGYHRYTSDMDLWLEPTKENLDNLYQALEKELGYPPDEINHIRINREIENATPIRLFSDDDTLFIDLMTTTFQNMFSWKECAEASNTIRLGSDDSPITVPVVHINHLIRMKENSKRLDNNMKDLVDAQELKKIQEIKQKEKNKGKGFSL